jgi:RimJ/RimL family protein N-acetyltransferase
MTEPGAGAWTLAGHVKTNRLVLRPHRPTDLDDLVVYHGDPTVTRYLPWPVRDRAATEAALAVRVRQGTPPKPGDALVLAIEEVASRTVIGEVLLKRPEPDDGSAELGFALRADRHGVGLAAEAASAMMQVASESLGLSRLTAVAHPDNLASSKLLTRLGFERLGRVTEHGHVLDQYSRSLPADGAGSAGSTSRRRHEGSLMQGRPDGRHEEEMESSDG